MSTGGFDGRLSFKVCFTFSEIFNFVSLVCILPLLLNEAAQLLLQNLLVRLLYSIKLEQVLHSVGFLL